MENATLSYKLANTSPTPWLLPDHTWARDFSYPGSQWAHQTTFTHLRWRGNSFQFVLPLVWQPPNHKDKHCIRLGFTCPRRCSRMDNTMLRIPVWDPQTLWRSLQSKRNLDTMRTTSYTRKYSEQLTSISTLSTSGRVQLTRYQVVYMHVWLFFICNCIKQAGNDRLSYSKTTTDGNNNCSELK